MKNQIKILITLILAIVVVSGCTYGSSTTLLSSEENTNSMMSMTYKKFSGYKATNIKVKEGETLEVSANIESIQGKLGLTIVREKDNKDGKDETVYEGTELPTSEFKIILDKPGRYTIKVTGDKSSGSYRITWDNAGNKQE